MPTENFERLKTDRKNAIIKAATREFATRDYSEVSVRDIAERADISRGSFYLYFYDKEDCFMAVIEAYKSHVENDLLNIYKKAKSIADVVLQIFDYFTHLSAFEHGLFEKISSNMNGEVQELLISSLEQFGETINQHLEETLENKNIEITPSVREQINLRREIIFSVLLASIVEMTIGRVSLDDTRNNLIKKIDIVMKGFGDITNKIFGDN